MKKALWTALFFSTFGVSLSMADVITFNNANLSGSVLQWANMTNYRHTEGDYEFGINSSFSSSWNGGVGSASWIGDLDGTQYGYITAGSTMFMKRTDSQEFTLTSLSLQNGSTTQAGSVEIYKDWGLGSQSLVTEVTFNAGEIKTDILLNITEASNVFISGGINTGNMYGVDNINVVPEPATAGLLGLSAGALWLIRRLKKAMNYYRT